MKLLLIIAMLLTSIYVGGVMAAKGDVLATSIESKVNHDQHQTMTHDKPHWTKYPLIEALQSSSRSRAEFEVKNIDAEYALIFPPTGTGQFPDKFAIQGKGDAYQEALHNKRFSITPKARGNYYWMMARHETAQAVFVANSVRYFTMPGPAPTKMLGAVKSKLQITPDPLPREHWRYREGETWQFKLSFDNKVLPHTLVLMETENGTKEVFESNEHGVVSVVFPTDIDKTKQQHAGGHHGRPKSQFVLAVHHSDDGRAYETTFNYQYAASAMDGKSLTAGFGFIAFGGLLALPLLRRSKGDKKRNRHD
jgi:hypothetical protein